MSSKDLKSCPSPLMGKSEGTPQKISVTIGRMTATSAASSITSNRFLPPGTVKLVVGVEPKVADFPNAPALASRQALKRKYNGTTIPEDGNKLAMFQGRDESYPDELNKLIQPLSCQLCKVHMTSMKSAKDHYESKVHDRHISAWLAKNYTEVGLQTPPIKRMVKLGPAGPNAFHCNVCDLPLTSMAHARQHYAGRKHQLVVQKRSKPSGSGFYDAEGKWVRTGSKAEVMPDDGRFGIGQLFVRAAAATEAPAAPAATNGVQPQQKPVVDDSLTCKICNIAVTSASQIQIHLAGAKHQRNLRKQNLDVSDASVALSNGAPVKLTTAQTVCTDLDPDLYRTPLGNFYCKICNMPMNHIFLLQQHLQGKKHLRTIRMQSERGLST